MLLRGDVSSVRVGVDVGGTFTDVVVQANGRLTIWKLPSTPDDQSEAFDEGVRAGLKRAGHSTPSLIAHGTTVATNAVLERRGAVTALVTTEGFRDILQIGRQNRPSLYDLWADRPQPLVQRDLAVGIPERMGPRGDVVLPLQESRTAEILDELLASHPESIAVCLLFSFANPEHERRIEELIRKAAPGIRISLSSRVLPEFREYERASTTALDAYVGPVIERYVGRILGRVEDLGSPVVVMRSGGTTMMADQAAEEPVHTLLSGPAAGVRGASAVAKATGFSNVVTFDMGGTSTDVCLVEGGEPHLDNESSVDGLPFRTPALAVHTVGAGGGSILWLDPGGALRSGPHSAGAVPGPACYGQGGQEPTVTDAHVVVGHLDPENFLGGRARLDPQAAERAFASLADRLSVNVQDVALAGLDAVRAQMSKAIRVVTVERGRHPRDFALVPFGGAGPMHATMLAGQLEMGCVIVPPAPGVLSAFGLLTTPLAADSSLTRPMVDPDPRDVKGLLDEIADRAERALRSQGAVPESVYRTIDCRYRGQAHEVSVSAEPLEELSERFASEHRARFGWEAAGEPVELVTFRVQVRGATPPVVLPDIQPAKGATPSGKRTVWTREGPRDTAVYERASLGAGDILEGPCLVTAEESTTVIDAGWDGQVHASGTLIMRQIAS
jgi:N-methylhydantoinase A